MKNLIFLLVWVPIGLLAQRAEFQGEINYEIEYGELPPEMEAYSNKLTREVKWFVGDGWLRSDKDIFPNRHETNIVSKDRSKGIFAHDIRAMKLAYDYNPSEWLNYEGTRVELAEGTKSISGYLCRRALIYVEGDKEPLEVYYTDQIPAWAHIFSGDLPGFPLSYENSNGKLKYTVKAVRVIPGPQPEDLFTYPEGYEVVSQEEFKTRITTY
ncbi:MAG TPA: hypothetical protein DDX92_04870 [Flavobacteriales bacterium]|jgi:GLPGLI family protein|nr:hypothetical protein [Flavobacteriales bacterium]